MTTLDPFGARATLETVGEQVIIYRLNLRRSASRNSGTTIAVAIIWKTEATDTLLGMFAYIFQFWNDITERLYQSESM